MRKLTRLTCLLLAMVLMLSLFGCGKKTHKGLKPVDVEPYLGTWQANDHNHHSIVHYLIFDSNGYWNIYMNYDTLVRAIKQLPEQLVSFKVFRELQKSDHTGCYYEYVAGVEFTDEFEVDEKGFLSSSKMEGILFTKVSDDFGEPNAQVVAEARDLFDRALMEAHSK